MSQLSNAGSSSSQPARYWPHVIAMILILAITGTVAAVTGRPADNGDDFAAPARDQGFQQSAPAPSTPSTPAIPQQRDIVNAAVEVLSTPPAQPAPAPAPAPAPPPAAPSDPMPPGPPPPPAPSDDNGDAEGDPLDPALEALEPLLSELQPHIDEIVRTVSPFLSDAASELSPAAAALGPLLRPICSGVGLVIVVYALVGGTVPAPEVVNPFTAITPVLILCSATFDESPLDLALDALDDAVGPTISGEVVSGLNQIGEAIAPIRDAAADVLVDVCANAALAGGIEAEMPKPVNRLSLIGFVCAGRADPAT